MYRDPLGKGVVPETFHMLKRPVIALAVLILAATVAGADTLAQIKKRGFLTCGSNPGLAGFGLPDEHGHWSGFDVDFCRALAAAIFNDAGRVKFVPLTAEDRLAALQTGAVDVLANNTTWTLSRETGQGLLFAGVNYFDGQRFMAHKKLNLSSALAAIKAYDGGRCDVYTSDATALYARRIGLADPEDSVVLPEIISKEPLGPVVRQGDDRWFNVVRWVNFAMINAEELGVTSKNVDEKARSKSPDIRRLLGFEGNFAKRWGLTRSGLITSSNSSAIMARSLTAISVKARH
jgi:general L-amino acid transport system substrate-binding protein